MIFSIDQRLVESLQRNRLENRGDLRDSSGTDEQRGQSEHESIDGGQRWGAVPRTTADDQLMLQDQGLGDNGANTTGSHELGKGDDKLNREKKQVTHRQGRLPWTQLSTILLVYSAHGRICELAPDTVADQKGRFTPSTWRIVHSPRQVRAKSVPSQCQVSAGRPASRILLEPSPRRPSGEGCG